MIFGLDISSSIIGLTFLNDDGDVLLNEAWDLRKIKNIFKKAEYVEERIADISMKISPKNIFIEQSLQSFRSGFSSASTLSLLSRFNGIVSWLCFKEFGILPEYIAATSARKECGIRIPKGQKAKKIVVQHIIDNVPDVSISYTRYGNPKAACYDKADSWVIAHAGWLICQKKEK